MNNKLVKQTFKVPSEFENYRLDKLIKKLQPQWSKVFILKNLRNKDIKVNHKKANANYHLVVDDIVTYLAPLNSETIETNCFTLKELSKLPALHVLFENDDLIIVFKPAKVGVQQSKKNNYDCMNNRLIKHLQFNENQGVKFKPTFVHRLDTNTEGILLGVKNYKTYTEVFKAFKAKKVYKIYDALVWNNLDYHNFEIKNYLLKDPKTNISKVVPNNNNPLAKFAHSRVQLVENFNNQAHIKVQIFTGRSHQIRIHLNSINHSICGDGKYSFKKENKLYPYQALVASELWFDPSVCTNKLAPLLNKKIKINKIWFLNPKYIAI